MELNGLRNIIQSTGPLVSISSDLRNILKETWTEDSFKQAFDIEIQGSDMKQGMRRQITPMLWADTIPLAKTNPFSATERAARQRELMQRLAIAQKNKPSYRQRQKNGRAGRK